MMRDIATIVWKEMKEIFLQRGSMRSGLFNLVIIIGLLGIFMPLQFRSEWLTNPIMPLMWAWIPVFMSIYMITDAFAGERERRTLETLLASRLSDQAILFGKIAAAVLYALSISFFGLLLGAVTVNIARPAGGLQFYDPLYFLALNAFNLLAALLLSALGVLVSLRAASARQAYQRISIVLLALYLPPVLLPQVLPAQLRAAVSTWLAQLDPRAVLPLAALVLLLIDAGLMALAVARFQRSKLMVGIE